MHRHKHQQHFEQRIHKFQQRVNQSKSNKVPSIRRSIDPNNQKVCALLSDDPVYTNHEKNPLQAANNGLTKLKNNPSTRHLFENINVDTADDNYSTFVDHKNKKAYFASRGTDFTYSPDWPNVISIALTGREKTVRSFQTAIATAEMRNKYQNKGYHFFFTGHSAGGTGASGAAEYIPGSTLITHNRGTGLLNLFENNVENLADHAHAYVDKDFVSLTGRMASIGHLQNIAVPQTDESAHKLNNFTNQVHMKLKASIDPHVFTQNREKFVEVLDSVMGRALDITEKRMVEYAVITGDYSGLTQNLQSVAKQAKYVVFQGGDYDNSSQFKYLNQKETEEIMFNKMVRQDVASLINFGLDFIPSNQKGIRAGVRVAAEFFKSDGDISAFPSMVRGFVDELLPDELKSIVSHVKAFESIQSNASTMVHFCHLNADVRLPMDYASVTNAVLSTVSILANYIPGIPPGVKKAISLLSQAAGLWLMVLAGASPLQIAIAIISMLQGIMDMFESCGGGEDGDGGNDGDGDGGGNRDGNDGEDNRGDNGESGAGDAGRDGPEGIDGGEDVDGECGEDGNVSEGYEVQGGEMDGADDLPQPAFEEGEYEPADELPQIDESEYEQGDVEMEMFEEYESVSCDNSSDSSCEEDGYLSDSDDYLALPDFINSALEHFPSQTNSIVPEPQPEGDTPSESNVKHINPWESNLLKTLFKQIESIKTKQGEVELMKQAKGRGRIAKNPLIAKHSKMISSVIEKTETITHMVMNHKRDFTDWMKHRHVPTEAVNLDYYDVLEEDDCETEWENVLNVSEDDIIEMDPKSLLKRLQNRDKQDEEEYQKFVNVPHQHQYVETLDANVSANKKRVIHPDIRTSSSYTKPRMLTEMKKGATSGVRTSILGRGKDSEERVFFEKGPFNMSGVHHGNNLSSMLSSELSFLSTPLTENLFFHKYSEGKLMCYDYEGGFLSKLKDNTANTEILDQYCQYPSFKKICDSKLDENGDIEYFINGTYEISSSDFISIDMSQDLEFDISLMVRAESEMRVKIGLICFDQNKNVIPWFAIFRKGSPLTFMSSQANIINVKEEIADWNSYNADHIESEGNANDQRCIGFFFGSDASSDKLPDQVFSWQGQQDWKEKAVEGAFVTAQGHQIVLSPESTVEFEKFRASMITGVKSCEHSCKTRQPLSNLFERARFETTYERQGLHTSPYYRPHQIER